ncbi:M23 family metallopeptidase [Dactylosporangium sp. CS-047395]|uniref:M23 family metallopeptidase n=1 Tax=Dactylosporangium sp. CS-047395 TaxID=3239936 RepID=UPI003D8A5C46
MTGRMLTMIAVCIVGLTLCCVGGLAAVTGVAVSCGAGLGGSGGDIVRYDAEQRGNAARIAAVGARRGIPVRGWVIAVAAAIQESGLRNLGDLGAANDHDSLGLFQQRPSQGWGTPQQLLNPEYAAGAFYDALLRVPGWQALPLTRAAQAVQRSAYPDAYAKWEADATALAAAAVPGRATDGGLTGCTGSGWTRPVDAAIVSPFRGPGRPSHDGVDLGAGRGTPIRAAAAGVVITVRCNAHRTDGSPYSCDIDGDPQTVRGCGWYAEIAHPDGTVTRYCHLQHQPAVAVGDPVTAGQPIGVVGSSGHSSGPHLHFETHTGRPASPANAVNPVAFMSARGVNLTAPCNGTRVCIEVGET